MKKKQAKNKAILERFKKGFIINWKKRNLPLYMRQSDSSAKLCAITATLILFANLLGSINISVAAGVSQWTPFNEGVTIASPESEASPGSESQQQGAAAIRATDGNFITAWQDDRKGNNDIFAQKLSLGNGAGQWGTNGTAIVIDTANQPLSTIAIVSDNNGGAIIAWDDDRSSGSEVFVQRINSNGAAQWTTNGILIDDDAATPQLVEDGTGGAFMAWVDSTGVDSQIFLTHLDSSGNVEATWNTQGSGDFRPVSIGTSFNEANPSLVTSTNGGVLVSYLYVSGPRTTILAAKIGATGTILWEDVVIEANIANGPSSQKSVDDGAGGIITVYNRGPALLIAQRQNSAAGALQWGRTGLAFVSTAGIANPDIVSDNQSGVIATWQDTRTSTNEVFAQRIDADGTSQWTGNGEEISDLNDGIASTSPRITSNGGLGAIIAWEQNGNLYAQHLTSNGAAQWTSFGQAVNNSATSDLLNALAPDQNGGALVVWQGNFDSPSSTYDIQGQYMQDTVGGLCSEASAGQFCGQQTISSSILSFNNIPDTFSFGTITSGTAQELFNNNNPPDATQPGSDDLLQIIDDRGSGGFTLTVDASSTFTDGSNTIPLNNLYITTSTDETDAGSISGVTYSPTFSGDQSVSAPLYVDTDTTSITTPSTYTSFGASSQFGGTPIVLMDGTLGTRSGRNGTMSLFTNFHLHIDAFQPAGTYSLTLTYTLTDATT